MPFNLLILPLVGGYYIIANSEWYKYKTQRLHNERLLFNSVLAGVILIIISLTARYFATIWLPELVRLYRDLLPIKQPYIGVTFGSILIAIGGTEITNLFISVPNRISLAIDEIGNELEKLLKLSQEDRTLVQLTLKNEKVYVGICGRIPKPDKTTYFVLIPFLSGFRDPRTKTVEFTTDYLDVYASYIKEGVATGIDDLEMNLVIKTEEVLTISKFDIEMYDRFNQTDSSGDSVI